MADFVNDNFTDTDGTDLDDHTPGTGGTISTPNGTSFVITSGKARAADGGGGTNLYSATPPSADYSVEASFELKDSGYGGLLGRFASGDGYAVVHRGFHGWKLYSMGGYAPQVELDAAAEETTPVTRSIRMEFIGTTINVYMDGSGTPFMSAVDSTYTGAGGVGLYSVVAGGASSGIHFDSFRAFDDGGDVTPPTISSWATNTDGDEITGTLSEAGCGPASGTGGFNLDGTSATVSSWAISGTTITLTLSGTIYDDETVTLDYDDGTTTDDIVDAATNKLADITNAAVTNNSTQTDPGDVTPPTASSWASNAGGNQITATLSESGCVADGGGTSGSGGFTLTGTPATVSGWSISGTTLTLSLTNLVYQGEVVTVAYSRAGTTDDIKDAAGNYLANIGATSVTNNSTQTGAGIGGGSTIFATSVIRGA